MMFETGLILSIPELRLGLQLLGFNHWDALPLLNTGEPPQQRIMNAFLGLIRNQLLLPGDGGYTFQPDFESVLRRIGQAERCSYLWEGSRILAFLYEKDGSVAAVTPDRGNWEHCVVTLYPDKMLHEAAGEIAGDKPGIELREPADAEQQELYNMERLALFFEARTEEAE